MSNTKLHHIAAIATEGASAAETVKAVKAPKTAKAVKAEAPKNPAPVKNVKPVPGYDADRAGRLTTVGIIGPDGKAILRTIPRFVAGETPVVVKATETETTEIRLAREALHKDAVKALRNAALSVDALTRVLYKTVARVYELRAPGLVTEILSTIDPKLVPHVRIRAYFEAAGIFFDGKCPYLADASQQAKVLHNMRGVPFSLFRKEALKAEKEAAAEKAGAKTAADIVTGHLEKAIKAESSAAYRAKTTEAQQRHVDARTALQRLNGFAEQAGKWGFEPFEVAAFIEANLSQAKEWIEAKRAAAAESNS